MREILFRGKRLDNGEWILGALLNDRDGAFYICPAATDITYCDNRNRRRIGCWYAVHPNTIGQFIGLYDKNGKRIFEGDIVNIGYPETTVKKTVITYIGASFYGARYDDDWELDNYEAVEVIGNIHDRQRTTEGGTSV